MNSLLVKDEALRNQALERYEVLHPATDPVLNEIVRLTARTCEAPIALVSLVTSDCLLLKARFGVETQEVSLGGLPCEIAIQGDTVYELTDARLHPDFSPDGIVLEQELYPFYAAAPLCTSGGVNIGTLCILDRIPRRLTEAQTDALSILSRQVITRLESNGLNESEARYRQLVEGSLGMVFTHDMRGRLLSINSHGAEAVGRTAKEMVGSPLAHFVTADRRAGIDDYLADIAGAGEAQGMLYLEHANGETHVIAYRNKLVEMPGHAPYVLGFGVDITQQVRAEGRLRTLTRQSDLILESVGDGIYCIDLEGRVTVVNAAAAQMLGYRREEMLGRIMHNLVHHTRADGTLYPSEESPIRRSLSNFGTARIVDEVFWRKDGTSFPVEYVARPLLDISTNDSGRTRAVGVVVAFMDTTERKALSRMKDEFISTVSHELRTPLTSLRGALGLLAGGALERRPGKSQQMLDIAINNADRLVRLVNNIVDLERIQSGKSELHSTIAAADDLLRRAIDEQQAQTSCPDARFFHSADGVAVWADPERILQVFSNLLSNAIKFSPAGGEIRLTARNLDNQEAIFEVSDQGQGIAADKLEKIFDRFQQGDTSDTRTPGGTGLGLAICRSIVNQHGGRIWATSTPGRGTTIHFTLPIRPRTNLR
ncbi:MAG TPA: ATP-binding protein [Edaphobacter sp.]